jgi:hypothetical protein
MSAPRLFALSLMALVAAGACRKDHDTPASLDEATAHPASDETPTLAAATTASPATKVNSGENPTDTSSSAGKLPKLKPINERPFPEGASEEQVCEAIKSTQEKDLWVRFGHLLPLFNYGSIFIVEGDDLVMARIENFVRKDYIPGLYRADMKVCGARVLLWMNTMIEETQLKFQRDKHGGVHFAAKLREELGLTVTESIFVDGSKEGHQFADYCRADPQVCEKLVSLDRTNKSGLCSIILSDTRLRAIPPEERRIRCQNLAASDRACLVYDYSTLPGSSCTQRALSAILK